MKNIWPPIFVAINFKTKHFAPDVKQEKLVEQLNEDDGWRQSNETHDDCAKIIEFLSAKSTVIVVIKKIKT